MSELSDEILRSYLALNLVAGIGPRTQRTVLDRLGSPERFFAASSTELSQIPGIGPKVLKSLDDHNYLDQARRELEECRAEEIGILTEQDSIYPEPLQKIVDPPIVLYCQGELLPADQLAVAIVGSRNCTMYGRRMAERIAAGLARAGITIVSGLARGIDAVAHRAALTAGGRTIAVCASGLKQMYPPEHTNLAEEIAAQGAVISESPLHRKPSRGLFPQRNRIVSGLCLGVVVIEASTTSGTLHTARHALEQGRDVFAVPGPVESRESEGCHQLIRDGVPLVRGVDDILQDLGPLVDPIFLPPSTKPKMPATASEPQEKEAAPQEVRMPRELNLSTQQTEILSLIPSEPVPIDIVIEKSGIEASRVLSTLTILQMKKLVERHAGNRISRRTTLH